MRQRNRWGTDATRTKSLLQYCMRRKALQALGEQMTIEKLWQALLVFQDCPFYTAKKLRFTYHIKGNEMFVDRKDKSITMATVDLAFRKALELGEDATGPKKLGCFGASYLYPVFRQMGVIGPASRLHFPPRNANIRTVGFTMGRVWYETSIDCGSGELRRNQF